MATFLFDSFVFGPVISRRLGVSLGINLLPVDGKICSFDCVYCECGLNADRKSRDPRMPSADEVAEALVVKLNAMKQSGALPDVITFAGNGEPTLHPDFSEIIDRTLSIRDAYCPQAKVSVLSNSTRIWDSKVVEALKKVEFNILKLDSAMQSTVKILNRPKGDFCIDKCIAQLKRFDGQLIIQTLFCRGEVEGQKFDNTSDDELRVWLKALKEISPQSVMIYSISRDTPIESIEVVDKIQLERIAEKVSALGLKVEVA